MILLGRLTCPEGLPDMALILVSACGLLVPIPRGLARRAGGRRLLFECKRELGDALLDDLPARTAAHSQRP